MIEEIGEDGEPIAPTSHTKKFVSQCGVLVRDNISITIQEWKKTKTGGVSYVDKSSKDTIFRMLMVNFTLPAPDEEDPNDKPGEEDLELNIVYRKFKKCALSKMATQFNNWKKILDKDFVQKEKTPVFTELFEKIRDQWDAFVTYKTLEVAKKRSVTNKKNASNKKYFHILGHGGYKAGKPK
jgi:hypothetical protein